MDGIRLRSADGTDEFCLRIGGQDTEFGLNDYVQASCRVKGYSYDRLASVTGKPISESDRNDYDACLPQIVIHRDALRKLSSALSKWNNGFDLFEVVLSDANEQKMTIGLELMDDFICSNERPVAVFRYSVHRIAIEARFVVDGSTLTEFEKEINQAITLLK